MSHVAEDLSPDRLPRYAIYNGKRVRVLEYRGKDSFEILDQRDDRRLAERWQLTFIKSPTSKRG